MHRSKQWLLFAAIMLGFSLSYISAAAQEAEMTDEELENFLNEEGLTEEDWEIIQELDLLENYEILTLDAQEIELMESIEVDDPDKERS